MTVSELIEKLAELDQNQEVHILTNIFGDMAIRVGNHIVLEEKTEHI